MTRAEFAIVAVGTLFVAGVLTLAARRMAGRSEREGEVARMREVYVGWSLYEADAGIAPTLDRLGAYVAPTVLASPHDPRPAPGPLDPCLGEGRAEAKTSDAYLFAHARAGAVRLPPNALGDGRVGLLASGWTGCYRLSGGRVEFGPGTSRITTTGSAVLLGGSPGADGRRLFLAKP